MFFYNHNYNTMYHITRKSAEEGLRRILTSRVDARFNAKTSKAVIENIMSNISIPNEYANNKCIYMSVDNAFSKLKGLRFSITATEVIKCKDPDTGNELISIPMPKYKNKVDYFDLLPLNSINILSDLAECEKKEGIIKQSGDSCNMAFSIDYSYKSLIAEYLEEVFTRAYAIRIAEAINKTISSEIHRFFVYRINNKKPVIFEATPKGVSVLDTTSETSAISADLILKVIKLYTRDITCIDNELTKIANRIHNMILYNIEYGKEELKNSYDVIKESDGIKFCFQTTVNGVDFKFKTEPYNWISDFICAPLKDIEWSKRDSHTNSSYAPTYKGYRLVIPDVDMWLNDWPEIDSGKIYINGLTKKTINDDQITLKDAYMKMDMLDKAITDDTPVYFMVVLDK